MRASGTTFDSLQSGRIARASLARFGSLARHTLFGASPALRPPQVQRQQAAQNCFVGHTGSVVAPAVGDCDGRIERFVRVIQPRRASVAKIGQRALFEFGLKAG